MSPFIAFVFTFVRTQGGRSGISGNHANKECGLRSGVIVRGLVRVKMKTAIQLSSTFATVLPSPFTPSTPTALPAPSLPHLDVCLHTSSINFSVQRFAVLCQASLNPVKVFPVLSIFVDLCQGLPKLVFIAIKIFTAPHMCHSLPSIAQPLQTSPY